MHFPNFNIFQQLLSDDTSLSSSIFRSMCEGSDMLPQEQFSLLSFRVLQMLVALFRVLNLHDGHPG